MYIFVVGGKRSIVQGNQAAKQTRDQKRMKQQGAVGYKEGGCSYLRTSKPLAATTVLGMVSVTEGSITARVGLVLLDAMPVLACMDSKSKMESPVHSLPVPAVVGQAM